MPNKEELKEKIKSLHSMPADKRSEYVYRAPLISLLSELFVLDLEYAVDNTMHDLFWTLQKELIDKIRADMKFDQGKANSLNALHSCFGELREAVMLVEHKYGIDGMFTTMTQPKLTMALEEQPRDSTLRRFTGTFVLHMGDIFRYLDDKKLCHKYYAFSLAIQPEMGQVYNQLGVLFENIRKNPGENENLRPVNRYQLFTSSYYYYRAIFAPTPFGAERNAINVLSRVLKDLTSQPPTKPDFEEIFLALLQIIHSNSDMNNESAMFKQFRLAIREQILNLDVEKFLYLLIMLLGTYEMMNKKLAKNRRIIEHLLTEIYEVLVGLLLQNWNSAFINIFHLYVMSMMERFNINLEAHPSVEASFTCIREIMVLYLEHELQPDPLRDYFIDCFTPLRDLLQTDLSYGSFHAYLKSICPRRETKLPISTMPDTTSVCDVEDPKNMSVTSDDEDEEEADTPTIKDVA